MMFFSAMDVQTVGNTHFWIKQKYPIVLFVLVFCTQAVLCTGDCDGTFATTSGSFNSPNFPYNYNNNQDCTYLISLPRDYRVTLTFFNFSLESSSSCVDYVQIFDGNSTAAPSFGKYCAQKPSHRLRTTHNEMLVRFHTDGSTTSTGFNASYSSDLLGDQFIVRSTSTDMRRLDSLTISSTGSVPVELHSLRNLEFDGFDFKIFWTENNDTRIYSVFLNGTSRTTVADLGENAVLSDIAFDAPSALLFYLDSGNDVVGVYAPAGDAHMRVITTGLQDQSAIAVDTQLRKVYWTADNKIKRVNYDGSGDTIIFSHEGLKTLRSITVDSQRGQVYFLASDRDTATLTRLSSDGTQPTVVYTTLQTSITATRICFYDERIFFINVFKNSTQWKSQVDFVRRDGKRDNFFAYSSAIYQDFSVYNESAWRQEPTECRRNQSVCRSHQICLPGPNSSVEYELGDQIIVEGAQGFLRRLDWETVSYTGYVKEHVYGLSNVEFDVFDFRIFWTERTNSRIHSILLNGSDNRIVVDLGQDAVLSDIAFDSPSGLLFYLDSGNDVIGVVSSSGDAHPVISTDLQDGSRISLDTKIGKVFWTSGRTLQSAHYDGSNVKTLLSSTDQSTILSVAVDSRTGDIYFLEVEDEVAAIQSLQSDGEQPRTIHTVNQTEWRTTRVIFDEYDDLIYHINVNTTSTKPMSRLEKSSRNRYVGEQFHTIGYIVEDVAFYRQTAAHQKQTECRRNKLGACGPGQICIPLPSGSVKCISTDPGANSAADDDDDDDNRLAIIGGALGGFAFIVTVVLVVVLVVFLIRSKRAKRQRNDTSCGTATMAYSSRPRADDEHFYDSPHHNDGYIHPISVVPEHSRR